MKVKLRDNVSGSVPSCDCSVVLFYLNKVNGVAVVNTKYLHFHCESLNEPLRLRCGSYLHEQIDLSHTHIRAI